MSVTCRFESLQRLTLRQRLLCSFKRQLNCKLRWTGHVIRMNDSKLPKAVFYGELAKGKRLHGGQRVRYKDVGKRHLKAIHITVDNWETLTQDRQQWRQSIHKGKSLIEGKISQTYQHDHNFRHGFPDASVPIIFCVNCWRGFTSQIELFSHQRANHVTTAKKKKKLLWNVHPHPRARGRCG